MIQTIRVADLQEKDDLKGKSILHELQGNNVEKVRCARVYYLEGASLQDAKILSKKLFSESLTQIFTINAEVIKGASQIVQISYKPGVMNPEVASIMKASKDLGIKLIAADSSTEYHFFGKLKKDEIFEIAQKLKLFNPTIEHLVEASPGTLLIKGVMGKTVTIPIRVMNEKDLEMLSKDKLYLNLSEMKVIQNYFTEVKRDPTDCELETIAQTWSEHCAHKTFKAKLIVDGRKKSPLIKRLQKESLKHSKYIVSSFVDNSGVMEFYDGLSICGKAETHNSPSAIEPYGGAATGSGGVFRDILGTGLGAKTIASTDIFCFAYPKTPASEIPAGCLPPEYLFKRVVTGVKDYGNRMGIPTNNGSVHFHKDFRAKPTVIVGAYGLIPTKKAKKGKPKTGDYVVVVGGRTGRDGIHGATFSSAEMTHDTVSVNSSAVQIGNAIEEKRMFDAILEASHKNLIRAVQDCGAGGFSSAIGEMGEDLGVHIDISKAPLKYQGLSPWEIWVSESQERMALAISKKSLKKFLQICKTYNVGATVLGVFTGKKKITITAGKEVVCNLDTEFLFYGLPQRVMIAKKPQNTISKNIKQKSLAKNLEEVFLKVLANENISSKEPIVRLYDHTVQGTNAMQPFIGETLEGPTDAAVIRPILKKPYGMVLSHGLNPVLNNTDSYWGSIWASVEALSNYVAVGGNYKEASLINNYIWPFPDEEALWLLDRSVDAVVDIMRTFKIPVISGKDSLSSTYRGKDGRVIKIPPVLCMSVFGRIPDVSKTVTSDLKSFKSLLYLVGKLDSKNMQGSIYQSLSTNKQNDIPKPDLKKLPEIFSAIYKSIQSGQVLSVHDVSEGGIITAVFEMCVGGNVGAELCIPEKEHAENFLFNETSGCFVVEVKDRNTAKKLFKGIPHILIGNTSGKVQLEVSHKNKQILKSDILILKNAWQKPMKEIFT